MRLRLIFREVKANFLFFLDKFPVEVEADRKESRNENKRKCENNVKKEAFNINAETSTSKFVEPVFSIKIENLEDKPSNKTETSDNLLSICQNTHESQESRTTNPEQQSWQIVPNSQNSQNSSPNQASWQSHHPHAPQQQPLTPILKLPFTSQYTFANSIQWLTQSETVVKFFSNPTSAQVEPKMLKSTATAAEKASVLLEAGVYEKRDRELRFNMIVHMFEVIWPTIFGEVVVSKESADMAEAVSKYSAWGYNFFQKKSLVFTIGRDPPYGFH